MTATANAFGHRKFFESAQIGLGLIRVNYCWKLRGKGLGRCEEFKNYNALKNNVCIIIRSAKT